MTALRIGVACAVIDENDAILLSKRSDFNVWNLPTGRLDQDELLTHAVQREVREETGVECEVMRPVGLYFQQGRARLNILFLAQPAGGELLSASDESKANQYFKLEDLPEDMFMSIMARDAFVGGTYLYVLQSSQRALWQIKLKLALRWVKNYLKGRPEPKFPEFSVIATLTGEGKSVSISCNGESAPWLQLKKHASIRENLDWVGLGQSVDGNTIELVFKPIRQQRQSSTPVEMYTLVKKG